MFLIYLKNTNYRHRFFKHNWTSRKTVFLFLEKIYIKMQISKYYCQKKISHFIIWVLWFFFYSEASEFQREKRGIMRTSDSRSTFSNLRFKPVQADLQKSRFAPSKFSKDRQSLPNLSIIFAVVMIVKLKGNKPFWVKQCVHIFQTYLHL